MKTAALLASFLVFPGFLFCATLGLLVGWVDRKVTARVQWRRGPVWYQNFTDIAKLCFKETMMPEGASKAMFFGMPCLALAASSLLSCAVMMVNLHPKTGFVGDLIVLLYLALLPSVALMLAGASSGNPLASLGASREMKLILAYELPFILAMAVPIIQSGYSVTLSGILAAQHAGGLVIGSVSGILAFVVAVLVLQAKLGMAPFDMAEAETEIVGGPYIEYTGKMLAVWKLTKAVMLVGLPALLVAVFLGGLGTGLKGILTGALEYVLIVVLFVLIKNTNPRVRIDHALGFFWGPVTVLASISVVLALLGM